jgi:hypothetical protein
VTDWQTISALTSAGCTVLLSAATLLSVRSAERTARSAERALLQAIRPVLIPSHPDDRMEKIAWSDGHWAKVPGGRAYATAVDGVVYLAISLRNAGPGLAVMHSWMPYNGRRLASVPFAPVDEFRPHSRDLYIPAGDVALWQGALRDTDDPLTKQLAELVAAREPFSLDLIYGDHEGGQRAVARFAMTPRAVPTAEETNDWTTALVRHWYLDRPDPR